MNTYEKRLQSELLEMQKNPPENCSAGLKDDNILEWKGTILGPTDSPFQGGIYEIDIKFNQQYPFKPPTIKFKTLIYHPNIDRKGNICLDILKDQWSPALRLSQILLSICSLLTDPNPNDPLDPDIASVYKKNIALYEITAREWTLKYAMDKNKESVLKKNIELNDDDSDDSDDSE